MERRQRSGGAAFHRRQQASPSQLPLEPIDRAPSSSTGRRTQNSSVINKINLEKHNATLDSPSIEDSKHYDDENRRNRRDSNSVGRDSQKNKKARKPLLILLSENCRKHNISGNQHHETSHILTEEWDGIPMYCQEALTTLKRILPRVEQRIPIGNNAKMRSSVSDLGHLCDFYNDVLRGGFCPHALHLFDLGKGALQVLPRVFNLLQHLASPALIDDTLDQLDNMNEFQSDPFASTIWARVCSTIASLIECVPNSQLQLCFIKDLIYLASDLSILDESQILYDSNMSPKIEATIFSETRQCILQESSATVSSVDTDASEYTLTVINEDAMISLKAAAFWILLELLSQKKVRKLSPLDLKYDIDECRQTPFSDLYFADICNDEIIALDTLQTFLSAIRQTLVTRSCECLSRVVRSEHTPGRGMALLSGLAIVSASNVLSLVTSDLTKAENPTLRSVYSEVVILILQATSSLLSLLDIPSGVFFRNHLVSSMSAMLNDSFISNGVSSLSDLRHQACNYFLVNLFELLSLSRVGAKFSGDEIETSSEANKIFGRLRLILLRMIRLIIENQSRRLHSSSKSSLFSLNWMNAFLSQESIIALTDMMKNPLVAEHATSIVMHLLHTNAAVPHLAKELEFICQLATSTDQHLEIDEVLQLEDHHLFTIACDASTVSCGKRKTSVLSPSIKRAKIERSPCSLKDALVIFLSSALASANYLLQHNVHYDTEMAMKQHIGDVQVVVSAVRFLFTGTSWDLMSCHPGHSFPFLKLMLRTYLLALQQVGELVLRISEHDNLLKREPCRVLMGVVASVGVYLFTGMNENRDFRRCIHYDIVSDIISNSKKLVTSLLMWHDEALLQPVVTDVLYEIVMSTRFNQTCKLSYGLPRRSTLFGSFHFVADDRTDICYWISPFLEDASKTEESLQENRLHLLLMRTGACAVSDQSLFHRTIVTVKTSVTQTPSSVWSRLLVLQSTSWMMSKALSTRQFDVLLREEIDGKSLGLRLIDFLWSMALTDAESIIRVCASRIISQVLSSADPEDLKSFFVTKDERYRGSPNPLTEFFMIFDIKWQNNLDVYREIASRARHEKPEHTTTVTSVPYKDTYLEYQRALIRILASLCWPTTIRNAIRRPMFEFSFNRVIDILSAIDIHHREALEGLCLAELEVQWMSTHSLAQLKEENLARLLSPLFRNFMKPGKRNIVSAGANQFRLLSWIIQRFLLRNQRSCPDFQLFDQVHTIELPLLLDSHLPSVLSHLIVHYDYEALQMTTAFKLYLMSQKRSREKMRKGIRESPVYYSLRDTVKQSYCLSLTPQVNDQLRELCLAPNVIERILPQILGEVSDSVITFFTKTVLQDKISLHKMIVSRRQIILKCLILEFCRSSDRIAKGIKALKVAAAARTSTVSEFSSTDLQTEDFGQVAACDWVSLDFLYLLVNAVQSRWNIKTSSERIDSLKCLCCMLDFLYAKDAPLFLPQIMATINLAFGQQLREAGQHETKLGWKLRLLAVSVLSKFLKLVALQSVDVLGNNLTRIVVSVIPLVTEEHHGGFSFDELVKKCRRTATDLLEWMARGSLGESLRPFFDDIPFVPSSPYLEAFKRSLHVIGVEFDNLTFSSTPTFDKDSETDLNLTSDSYSKKTPSDDSAASMQTSLKRRLEKLNPLLSDENSGTRIVTLQHLAGLLRSNRALFSALIESEESVPMKRSLTIAYKAPTDIFGGTVTCIVESLLSRCIHENDPQARTLLAKCFGEVGAISEHRLEQPKPGSDSSGGDGIFRSMKPPWRSRPARFELQLVTTHLVKSLKTASTASDQNKVAFTIQELLAVLDRTASESSHLKDGKIDKVISGKDRMNVFTSTVKQNMSSWLTSKLSEANVLEIVEPFWFTEFQEAENATVKQPPFFQRSSTFYGWLSNWCRYMVNRSYEQSKNKWSELFFACRTAVRTQAGLPVAEFLLPLLVLDRLCFGNSIDERILIREINDVLSWDTVVESLNGQMSMTERQKAVSVVFSTLDLFQAWSESETEQRHKNSRRAQVQSLPSRMPLSLSGDEWPLDESIVRIDDMLKEISLELRSRAAANVGMHAYSLRLLEMDIRSGIANELFGSDESSNLKVVSCKASGKCDKNQSGFLKNVLSCLNDYETMVALGEDDFWSSPVSRAQDSIQKNEALGDWDAALQDYETLQQLNNQNSTSQLGSLRCLMELGHFESVLHQAKGIGSRVKNVKNDSTCYDVDTLPIAVEAAWRLGRWESLSDLVNHAGEYYKMSPKPFQICFAEILLSAHKKSLTSLKASINQARHVVIDSLALASRESYSTAYEQIARLQSLCEVEDVAELVCSKTPVVLADTVNQTSFGWDHRLNLASSSGASSIINTRLTLARLANDQSYEGSLFLSIGKSARKKGLRGMAASAFAKAEAAFASLDATRMPSTAATLKLQYAKLKYSNGEVSAALKILGQENSDTIASLQGKEMDAWSIKRILGSQQHGLNELQMKEFFVKGALQSTRWMIEGGLKGGGEIISRFRTIHLTAPKWEKGHFQYAKYIDSVLRSRIISIEKHRTKSESIDDDSSRFKVMAEDKCCQKYVTLAMKHYSLALSLDVRHVYQALPRLLSLWFDFTSAKADSSDVSPLIMADSNASLTRHQEDANSLMEKNSKEIPAQAFYTAIPQLVSRISHNDKDTATIVRGILKRVLAKFPGQAMWLLAWIRQSRFRERNMIGNKIFKDAERILESSKHQQSLKLLVASKSLFAFLHQLAKHEDKDKTKKQLLLKTWRGEVELMEFIPPIQTALSVSILTDSKSLAHELFPRHIPRMRAFASEVDILHSKARRKDARVQDLNNVINRLLSVPNETKDFRGQRRRLRLRTFAVTCLSEETGLLEWVPSTEAFRTLVSKSYNPQAPPSSKRRRGQRITNFTDPSLRDNFENKCQPLFFKSGDLTRAASNFGELCLKQFPPLLYWWFVHNFPDPHSWYEARTRFALSVAIWSAVGHIIGLGDRHSENILIDTTSADCVHVDFDCIFDKGLHLPMPEVVPFRLTQNIIDAFGPTGADGMYSENLKVAMSTLRRNRDTLLSVLEPFANDPIIDWKRTRNQQRGKASIDQDDPIPAVQDRETKAAKRSINVIDERLRGIYNLRNPNLRKVKRTDTTSVDQEQIVGDEELNHVLPLSVEGQVHKLIAEATSNENLVQMYFGWMPWI